ncbi:MAG: gluconokinase [Paracoccaceae bacterium]|jgi:gluconokinase
MRAVLVMGVSGSGKSTIGAALAQRLGATFLDADDFHSPANVAWMAAGKPLTDDMRWPWLDRLAQEVGKARDSSDVVLACSALRRSYRDHLRLGIPELEVIYPDARRSLIRSRMESREGHFMPVALMDSQFATLDVPKPDEGVISVSAAQPVAAIVTQTLAILNG